MGWTKHKLNFVNNMISTVPLCTTDVKKTNSTTVTPRRKWWRSGFSFPLDTPQHDLEMMVKNSSKDLVLFFSSDTFIFPFNEFSCLILPYLLGSKNGHTSFQNMTFLFLLGSLNHLVIKCSKVYLRIWLYSVKPEVTGGCVYLYLSFNEVSCLILPWLLKVS